MLGHKLLAIGIARFSDRHHLHQFWMGERIAGINFPTSTGTNHQHAHRASGIVIRLS
ncbi:hypothetical protein D3C77_733430 [compost metagenome]